MRTAIKSVCPLVTVTSAVLANASFPLPFGLCPSQAAWTAIAGLAVWAFLSFSEPTQSNTK